MYSISCFVSRLHRNVFSISCFVAQSLEICTYTLAILLYLKKIIIETCVHHLLCYIMQYLHPVLSQDHRYIICMLLSDLLLDQNMYTTSSVLTGEDRGICLPSHDFFPEDSYVCIYHLLLFYHDNVKTYEHQLLFITL